MRLFWLALLLVGCSQGPPPVVDGVYALQYSVSKFPEKFVLSEARSGMVNFGWYVFAVRAPSGWTLIDTGPAPQRPEVPFQLKQPLSVKQLLGELGCREVKNIVLTHGHWDHAGGLADFPEAQVWLARAEYADMQRLLADSDWTKAYRKGELTALQAVEQQGRLHLLEGETEVTPGLRAFVVGGHTAGMLALLYSPGGQARLLLAGDNAYLERNLTQERPIAEISRHGPDALPQIRKLAQGALLIPGHEPDLLTRFPVVAPQIARLYP